MHFSSLLFISGFIISTISAAICILGARKFSFFQDTMTGVQKVHTAKVSRVGGLPIFTAFFFSFYLIKDHLSTEAWVFIKLLCVSLLPAFLGGLFEDLTKQVAPLARFMLTISAAIIAYFAVGASISFLNLIGIDFLLRYQLVSLLLTSLAVGGVANGTNMLDGFHGLLLGYATLAFLAFAYISWSLGDSLFLLITFNLSCICFGLFVFNWPKGWIFLGDGGSYSLGFLLAESAILLYSRHSAEVSPYALGIILSLPVVETLFSIYRRGWRMFEADDQHLHHFVYRYLKKRFSSIQNLNSWVMLVLIPLSSIPMLFSVFFLRTGWVLLIGFFVFFCLYMALYYGLRKKLDYFERLRP